MKKVLFATTALVASAGIASAQGVALSGSAEMGVVGGGAYGDNFQFWTDVDVTFTFSGETDNGLTFGGSIDLDESDGSGTFAAGTTVGASPAFAGTSQGGETVFLSGAFGTLTMGDTDGALDWALTEVAIGGSIDDAHTAHGGYSGGNEADGMLDGQIARYDYSFGDFSFGASVEVDDTGVADPTFGVGAKYSTSFSGVDLGFGLGYQSYVNAGGATQDAFGVSVDVMFAGGFQAILNYKELGDTDAGGVSETHWGVGVGYTFDAITVGANYGMYEEGANQQDGFGVAIDYDLGGGAEVQFGYGDTSTCGVYAGCATVDQFSLGVAMSF
ncbi:porin [Psychromarinibacter sp. C21-152]|uniref:Porin n=1 Tax=Psychromarinibacter sediminicola TaxID=3033385 RepID=A0AAE3T7Z2_9RHOB|nr:porin [Psychromarinibacter sediminicola]MDF0600697.1 porin [Psychromarinibacter sediminicola]